MTYKQRIVNPILFLANFIGFFDIYSLLRGHIKSQAAIIVYHRVGSKDAWSLDSVSVQGFEAQIKYLNKYYNILSLSELTELIQEKKPLPKRVVVLTFDDCYKDIYLYAYPILKKYSAPATIFLTPGHIGTGNLFWWDKIGYVLWNTKLKSLDLGELRDVSLNSPKDKLSAISLIVGRFKRVPEEEKNALIEKLIHISGVFFPTGIEREVISSWDEVKEMSENGIDFGAHTITHPILTKVSPDQMRYEITQSKKEIVEKLGRPVTSFSYPNGMPADYNSETINILKMNGFTCAVTGIPRMVALKSDLYELGRIEPGVDFRSFKLYVSGLYPDVISILSKSR